MNARELTNQLAALLRKEHSAMADFLVALAKSDAIPAHVKRAAWIRAGGRCEWRFESGERCNSTTRLEFDHHLEPRARGGPPTLENIRVRCKPHNDTNARLAFGDQWMDQFTRKRGRGGGR